MFIETTALLSIFQLIFAGGSTNLLFSNSENLTGNISDDMTLKNMQELLELLQTKNDNLSGEINSLGLTLNYHLTKQRNEMKDDLEKLKAALAGTKQLLRTVVTKETLNLLSLNYHLTKQRNEMKDDLDELKAALAGTKQRLRTVESNDPEDFYLNDDIQNATTKERSGNGHPQEKSEHLPKNCAEALDECGSTPGPWMIIQRRMDGSVDFYRNWTDYKHGFGNLDGEFFIGLDKLHAITKSRTHELWIQLEDFEGNKRSAKYSAFAIGNESQYYALNILGKFSGDAGDSLRRHVSMKWSTKDKPNSPSTVNCAVEYRGAWWYEFCYDSNLNGRYYHGGPGKLYASHQIIIVWYHWRGWYHSPKYVHMAIRPIPNRC